MNTIVVLCLFISTLMIVSHGFSFRPQVSSFIMKSYRCNNNALTYNSKKATLLSAIKKDLFSDDLFDDDEETTIPSSKKASDDTQVQKKYLDEKWKLNSEDAKEFTGFPRKVNDQSQKPKSEGSTENVSLFALMFKLRKEYWTMSIDSTLADHRGYCLKYKRIFSSEVIHLKKGKGLVIFWRGLAEGDKKETRDEITKFLEEEPFMSKDMIENWDVIDLNPNALNSNELPVQTTK